MRYVLYKISDSRQILSVCGERQVVIVRDCQYLTQEAMENTSKVAAERHFAVSHTGIVLALAALTAGCGGGASTSSTSAGAGTGTVTILEQPQESSITGNVVVPLADNSKAPVGIFKLVLWQPDIFTANGELVPTAWNASSQTGFAPSNPMSDQLGFQNTPGTSTAQMDGDTVGAYINSKDAPSSPVDPGGMNGGCGHVTNPPVQKMMITPQYIWSSGTEPVPFASSTTVLNGSLDLQVPTASGVAYVVADLLFEDPNGVRVSYGVKLFGNGVTNPVVGCGYDAPSNSYTIDSPLGFDERFVSNAANSASDTGVPWLGWQHFEWSISQSQFTAALQYLAPQFSGKIQDVDATQYVLAEVHLNAEINFLPGPAELGWSMRGLKIWLVN
jgi:hypothetical protein